MKILISADMEGISGIVDWEQVRPGHPEYLSRGRQLMAGDGNGAVTHAHSDARNILSEQLDPRARLNSGTPSPFSMLQSIDDTPTPDALVLIGYHAMAGTKKAVLDHTWSDTRV